MKMKRVVLLSAALLLLIATGTVEGARKNRQNKGGSSTTAKTLPKSTTSKPAGGNKGDNDTKWVDTGDNKIPDSTLCQRAHCSHDCNAKNGKAVCSCPDDRFYLTSGTTCRPRLCKTWFGDNSNDYNSECDKTAICSMQYDYKERQNMPRCTCRQPWNQSKDGRYVLNPDKKSCRRDTRYQTCNWPDNAFFKTCSGGCEVVSNTGSYGTHPRCKCQRGFKRAPNGKNCIIEDPCVAAKDGNGGCDQQCSFDKSKTVTCSCYGDYTVDPTNPSKCLLKNCQNGNSGCSHGCTQLDQKNFYCHCPKGWALENNQKTCYDYDECAGFHGCDHTCKPDGKGWFTCECDPGFELQANGYSCRVSEKCANRGCSQHCNPTTGTCYCDATHQLSSDGKTCVDVDECKKGTDGCSEICRNTDGGFICECRDPRARLSNDLKNCILDTCQELDDIQYGTTNCVHGHGDSVMKIGDYCTFSCPFGFKLMGAKTVHCTKMGYDYTPPHCQDINECEDPNRCAGDEQCVNKQGSFSCLCKGGFEDKDGDCTDRRGPEIRTCPSDASLVLPADSDTVSFSWAKPVVIDPTDAPSDITCQGCPASEQRMLGVGQTLIRYIYSDKAGNRALCSFKVKVSDVTPPVFQGCPDQVVFSRGPGTYQLADFVQGIDATDNSGQKPLITHDKPPAFRNPGLRTVNYFAKDSSDNQAVCTFYVNITVSDCAELQPPTNGYFANNCDDWHVGNTCEPKCNDGYAFFSHQANTTYRYQCTQQGQWTPAPDTMPECLAVTSPSEAEISFSSKYSGACPTDDPTSKDVIVGMVRDQFEESKSVFCFLFDSCSLASDPKIDCDKNAGTFTVTMKTDESYAQIPNHQGMVVEFKKKIRAEMERIGKSSTFMGLFIPPRTILTPLLNINGLPITPNFKLVCAAGSQDIENQCVTCPAGVSC